MIKDAKTGRKNRNDFQQEFRGTQVRRIPTFVARVIGDYKAMSTSSSGSYFDMDVSRKRTANQAKTRKEILPSPSRRMVTKS